MLDTGASGRGVSFLTLRRSGSREGRATPLRGYKTSRGSPAPGPTGSTWAFERSDERHAQQGAPSLKTGEHRPQNLSFGRYPRCAVFFNTAGIFMLFSALPHSASEFALLRGFAHVVLEIIFGWSEVVAPVWTYHMSRVASLIRTVSRRNSHVGSVLRAL